MEKKFCWNIKWMGCCLCVGMTSLNFNGNIIIWKCGWFYKCYYNCNHLAKFQNFCFGFQNLFSFTLFRWLDLHFDAEFFPPWIFISHFCFTRFFINKNNFVIVSVIAPIYCCYIVQFSNWKFEELKFQQHSGFGSFKKEMSKSASKQMRF